jgi:hypothetical protein
MSEILTELRVRQELNWALSDRASTLGSSRAVEAVVVSHEALRADRDRLRVLLGRVLDATICPTCGVGCEGAKVRDVLSDSDRVACEAEVKP